jgi:hypothetical protein
MKMWAPMRPQQEELRARASAMKLQTARRQAMRLRAARVPVKRLVLAKQALGM